MLTTDFVTIHGVSAPVTHLVALGFALRQVGCVQCKKAPHRTGRLRAPCAVATRAAVFIVPVALRS